MPILNKTFTLLTGLHKFELVQQCLLQYVKSFKVAPDLSADIKYSSVSA